MDEKEIKALLETVKSEVNTVLEQKQKGFIREEDYQKYVNDINENLKPIASISEKSEKLENAVNEVLKEVALLKENTTSYNVNPAKEKAEFMKALKEGAARLKQQGAGTVEITKTVGNMTFASSITGEIPGAEYETGITRQVRQQFTLRNLSTSFPIMSNLARYIEQVATEGTAGMTAEGAKKSQISMSWKANSAEVKKVTDYVKVSNEMLDDIAGLSGEIDSELIYQVDLKEESQILTGDGTGENLNGITKYAKTLSLGSLAGTLVAPNYFDVLGAAITQIRINGKGELTPNVIELNPVDIFLMIHATKSTTNEYVKPITVIANPNGTGLGQVYIWGIPVIGSDTIPAGSYLVSDQRKYTIRDKSGMVIQLGYENDDFTKNFVTIRGEKRLATYVKANHVEAFVYDTFAAGIVFLTAAS